MQYIFLCFMILLVGCTYEGRRIETYVDEPRTLLEDPLSVKNMQDLDALESSYLQKEITYAEYIGRKRQLEDDYQRDVRARQRILENVDNR